MVGVAQSEERWFVEPKVVGSKPTIHPIGRLSEWTIVLLC
jgi:hypothetical protein